MKLAQSKIIQLSIIAAVLVPIAGTSLIAYFDGMDEIVLGVATLIFFFSIPILSGGFLVHWLLSDSPSGQRIYNSKMFRGVTIFAGLSLFFPLWSNLLDITDIEGEDWLFYIAVFSLPIFLAGIGLVWVFPNKAD